MRGHGQQGKHPDDEEVVGDDVRRACQAERLQRDADEDLLVGVGGEELAADGGGPGCGCGVREEGGLED